MVPSDGHPIDIPLAHAFCEHGRQHYAPIALCFYSTALHHSEHSEEIQHWLGNAIRCQGAKAIKVGLALKFESPCQHPCDVGVLAIGKFVDVLQHHSRIRRIECPISVSIWWIDTGRACRASLRIRFTEYDGQIAKLRERVHSP